MSAASLVLRVRCAPVLGTSVGLTVSRGVSGVLITLSSVLVARAAGAATLGIYGLALTVGLYASTLADLGVSQYLLPTLGRAPRREWPTVWANAVRLASLTSAPFAALYAITVIALTDGSRRTALLAAGAWWLLVRASGYARPFFIAAGRASIEAAATVTEAILGLAATAALLLVSHSAGVAVTGLAAGAAVGYVLRLRGLRLIAVNGGSADSTARALAGRALPFAVVAVLTVVYLRIDVVLLSWLRDADELGLYQPPVRLVTALLILPDALAAVLLVRSAGSPGGTKADQERILSIGMPVGAALVALSAAGGGAFLAATFGAEFRQSWPALALLAATVPLALLASMNGNALTARGFVWPRVACLAAASVCAVGLGIPAITRYGYVGAAAVSVVNELTLAASYAIALAWLCGGGAIIRPRFGWAGQSAVSRPRSFANSVVSSYSSRSSFRRSQ